MDKDSSGENQTSSLVEKSKEVPSLEDDKWRTIQRSLEHHRLSKMYNSQKYESELWFAVAEPSNLDKDSETENNENARDDFDDEDTVNFWQNLFDEKENFESNSNVLSSFSERSLANNIIINDLKINTSHKNLSRKPDSNLLEDILSRTLVMGLTNNDDGDDDDVNEDASDLRTLVPKLDLSWLEDDDDNGMNVNGEHKNEPEMKNYHTTPESNSMTNHLQLIQTESDPLIGSPDMADDVNKSHCSSPERLESDQNHLNELNENLISKANRDRTSPRKTYFKNNSSRKESNPLPAQNTVTCGLVMTDIIKKDSKDSGFQEVTDSLETVEKAGVHGNGNQNSRLQRKCLYRRISGISKKKPETIEEEQPGVVELVKNGKFSSFSPKFLPKKGSTWNTIESIGPQFTQSAASKESSISFVHEQTSVATSQVSFNVSRQGDTLIKDGKTEIEQPKPVQVLPEVNHKLRALSKAEADLAEMDRWKSELDGEKSSLKRCYCFFCGLNCGIWFC